MGLCYREVMVEVRDGDQTWVYADVTAPKVADIVEKHLVGGQPIDEWLILGDEIESVESALLDKQTRIVLRNCGHIDPGEHRRLHRHRRLRGAAHGAHRAVRRPTSSSWSRPRACAAAAARASRRA